MRRLRLRIEAQVDLSRHQRVCECRTRFPGNTEAHAPHQFEFALDQRTGKFLLQRKKFDVKMGEPPALALGFGPARPDGFEIARVLSLDLRTKPVVRKAHARMRIHCGISRIGQARSRLASVPMRTGSNERGAFDLGGKLRSNQHRRADVEPGRQPGTVGLRGNFRSPGVRDRQPDLVVAVLAAVIQPDSFDGAGLVVEQQETPVIGDIRHHPAARAHRFLSVVDERNEAPLLEGHGRLNGSCRYDCVVLRVLLSYLHPEGMGNRVKRSKVKVGNRFAFPFLLSPQHTVLSPVFRSSRSCSYNSPFMVE